MTNRVLNFMALALLVSCHAAAGVAAPPRQPPNIVYILADDLGFGDLSCYGQQRFKTPNIDRLASRGMRFTQHYAGCTVCAPSRSTIFTGLHTGHTPVRGNTEVQPEGQQPLPPSTYTLAEHLQKHEYHTGLFGKWGLGAPDTDSEPLGQGFRPVLRLQLPAASA